MFKIKKISKKMLIKIIFIGFLISVPLTVAYLQNNTSTQSLNIGSGINKVNIISNFLCFRENNCIERIVSTANENFVSTVLYNGHTSKEGAFNGGNTSPSVINENYRLNYNGPFHATNFTAEYYVHQSSDINLKDNISRLKNSSDKIKLLNGVNFEWKNTGEKSIGLIAQEVEQVFPEFVTGEEGSKTVAYSSLVVPLIEAFKEKDEEIKSLEERVRILEEKLNNLGF